MAHQNRPESREGRIAHCTTEDLEALPTSLAQFADGTPGTVEFVGPPLKLGPGRGSSRISHRYGNYQTGFDKAEFGSADAFRTILSEHSLPEQPIVVDTSREHRDLFHSGVYVWVNSRVLLVSKYNPLTGRKVESPQRTERGLAYYIGLEGDRGAVRDLADAIERRLQIGHRTDGNRRYI